MCRVLLFSICFWVTAAMGNPGPEIRYRHLYVEKDLQSEAVAGSVSIQSLTNHFDWLRAHEYLTETKTETALNDTNIRIVFEYVEPKVLPHILALLELYDYRAVLGITNDWLVEVAESSDINLDLALRQLITSDRIICALDLSNYQENQAHGSSPWPVSLLPAKNDPANLISTAKRLRERIHAKYNVAFNHVLWPVGYYDLALASHLTNQHFTKHIWSHRRNKWRVSPGDRIGIAITGNRLSDLVSLLEKPPLYLHRGVHASKDNNYDAMLQVATAAELNAVWLSEQVLPTVEIETTSAISDAIDWYTDVSSLSNLESLDYSFLTRGISANFEQSGNSLEAFAESIAESVVQKSPTTFIGATIPLSQDALFAAAMLIESRALDFVVFDLEFTDDRSCTNTAGIVRSFTSSANIGALERARLVFRINTNKANADSSVSCINRLRYAGARSMVVRSPTLNDDDVSILKQTISLKSLPNELFIETQP